jgi:hypothetical protein
MAVIVAVPVFLMVAVAMSPITPLAECDVEVSAKVPIGVLLAAGPVAVLLPARS